MLRINPRIEAGDLRDPIEELWSLSSRKLLTLEERFDLAQGAPVFTERGRYRSRGWTDWTLGFYFGSMALQFDATGDASFLDRAFQGTVRHMQDYITHTGVHDHGFNVVSTFGNLYRLGREGRYVMEPWQHRFLTLALRASSAVQASRWTRTAEGGFIYSFNGPHSLFADTIRTLRTLALGYRLGHRCLAEGDRQISLLERLIEHALTTAQYSVYYGTGRDAYDVAGRVAHESLFNVNDGSYRCPATQQGYSPRSTWTRGLAWIILGFAEQLEFLETVEPGDAAFHSRKPAVMEELLRAARAAADYYQESSPSNGIPYWDTAAPGLQRIADWSEEPADPFNDFEPVDSSAAAIAAQGLLRLGRFLREGRDEEAGRRYRQAGLTISAALFQAPYLSRDEEHEGLILHSIYHRPNGWDYVPAGRRIPCGESSMWGDYHARELALYLQRIDRLEPYLCFWGGDLDE
jgi:unsaturated chondroitin disaccharide hydrolase